CVAKNSIGAARCGSVAMWPVVIQEFALAEATSLQASFEPPLSFSRSSSLGLLHHHPLIIILLLHCGGNLFCWSSHARATKSVGLLSAATKKLRHERSITRRRTTSL